MSFLEADVVLLSKNLSFLQNYGGNVADLLPNFSVFLDADCVLLFSRNLLFLKNYSGNVEDLSLNFTVVNNDLGESQVSEQA